MFDLITPDHLLIWVAVGGAVGWLAEAVAKRDRFGATQDIALGIFGGVAGAMIIVDRSLLPELHNPRLEHAVAAFIGAVVLIIVVTLLERAT